ncbi:MAG: GNAT family N-acetyltransferase, partial [Cytophagia bacterium]|nr:GNAT family N-acetyltransferase [Cytophagia bacterium]
QNMGLESVLTYRAFQHTITKTKVRDIELSWVGDFNEKMLAIHKGLGAEPSKKHITYRLEL